MEELNNILLHAVTIAWANKSYLQGWYFELNTYKETCTMFERMEVAEQLYEGGTPSKIPTWSEANLDIHVRKQKGEESSWPTNLKKCRAGKRKTKNAGHMSDAPTVAEKHSCCMAKNTPQKSVKY